MDLRQLSALLVKISGMVVIVFAVSGIPGYINSFLHQGQDTFVNFSAWVLSPLAFPLFIGLLMWSFSKSITNKIIKDGTGPIDSNEFLVEIERIAITVLGIILLFFALSDQTFNLIFIYITSKENFGSLMTIKVSAEDWGHIAGTTVEILFSLVLIARAEGITYIIRKLRS